MNSGERCSNCARYPLCNKCKGPTEVCENWKKRKIGETEWKMKRQ